MEELSLEPEELPFNITNHQKMLGSDKETSEQSSTQSQDSTNLSANLQKSSNISKKWALKRIVPLSDSDCDNGEDNTQNGDLSASEKSGQGNESALESDESEPDIDYAKSVPRKSRIQKNFLPDSDDSHTEDSVKNYINEMHILKDKQSPTRSKRYVLSPSESKNEETKSGSDHIIKNDEQQLRMKNKRNKLQNKFKSLLSARGKESQTNIEDEVNRMNASESSNESGDDMASIEKIKQKIQERMSFKPSICDPDTSDEESNQQKTMYKQKKGRKTKLISPKPQRMSAKQAMENMQKIKSESNRMLREKEVTLPYHRPKALSLKDIMSRRKLAVSADGKALPIKMNEEQLKQYAQMLEERQKEMMELCKSESEEGESDDDAVKAKIIPNNEINIDADCVENASTEISNDAKTITESHNQATDDTKLHGCTENNAVNESTNQATEQIFTEQYTESNMQLVYEESANPLIEESVTAVTEKIDDVINTENMTATSKNAVDEPNSNIETLHVSEVVQHLKDSVESNPEDDGQTICLRFDTENSEASDVKNNSYDTTVKENTDNFAVNNDTTKSPDQTNDPENDNKKCNIPHVTDANNAKDLNDLGDEISDEIEGMEVDKEFSDDDINMEDIDNIIENADIIKNIEDKVNSQFLVRDKPLNLNPKLTGAPGMVIDLDDSGTAPRKSGVELLKERFTYFSKLKTPEEMEREREKKLKPGTQLKKLKQELEEKIAEQRSIEWAKRLEEEKQQQKEMKALRGEDSDEDDIDKLEATLEGKEESKEDSEESDSGQEEPIENDVEIKDKPRQKNAMVDDEAEESECDEDEKVNGDKERIKHIDNDNEDNNSNEAYIENDGSESESESDESSESEDEQTVTKKSRILKAFEDSDDEDVIEKDQLSVEEENTTRDQPVIEIKQAIETTGANTASSATSNIVTSQIVSQDEDLQLAQRPISTSDDVFTSQESALLASEAEERAKETVESDETFTQTFSILDSSKPQSVEIDLNSSAKTAVGPTQSLDINNIEDITLRPVTDSQNNVPLPPQIPITQESQSQSIGEDILALCTGQFYNNQFVSQVENQPPLLADTINYDAFDNYKSQDSQEDADKKEVANTNNKIKKPNNTDTAEMKETDNFIELSSAEEKNKMAKTIDANLKSILDELDDPDFDAPKPRKYFLETNNHNRHSENQIKRKLVIDSDEETDESEAVAKKLKKHKKKKPEKRALQISDDEEEQSEVDEIEEYESEIEQDEQDRLVEYDSEENEIEVKPQNPKKKRKMAEFFENEAELTSEDEWAGSGDEDEAGLDRMEREEGDDDTFHQGALQRELGQIHMRNVLDQDKREVRIIQELLFEDGDLGGGGRQRKFKWNNLGDEETGTVPDEFPDTQEEEFESEEQWRKQRHEREMFLKQLQNKDEPEETLNVSVNRSTIIKANLLSKTMSSILMEVKQSTEKTEATVTVEKKTAKDIPSPKKPFALLQASYQGSLLSRGRGALARLAALATPLAADDDARVGTIGPNSRRNFVFAALTPEEKAPKVTKRKAESNPSTPKLVKKIRSEEKNTSRSSLLDHFKL